AGHPSLEHVVRMDKDMVDGVDFELEPSRIWRGRVMSSAGKPVADAWVAAQSNGFQGDDVEGVRTHADGTFELSHLRSDVHHLLFARKEHFGATALHMPDPLSETSSKEMSLPDIILLGSVLL